VSVFQQNEKNEMIWKILYTVHLQLKVYLCHWQTSIIWQSYGQMLCGTFLQVTFYKWRKTDTAASV